MPPKPVKLSPERELEERQNRLFTSFIGPEPKATMKDAHGAYTELLKAGGKGYRAAFEFANKKQGNDVRVPVDEQQLLAMELATPIYERALSYHEPELLSQAADIHLTAGNAKEARQMARLYVREKTALARKARGAENWEKAANHMAAAAQTARVHLSPGLHTTYAVSAMRHQLMAGGSIETFVSRHRIEKTLAVGLIQSALHAHKDAGHPEKAIQVARANRGIWPQGEALLHTIKLVDPRRKTKEERGPQDSAEAP